MKYKWVYTTMLAIVMIVMLFTAVTILSDIWKSDETESITEERTVTMLICESDDTLGLDRMIRKIYVEEKIRIDLQVVPDNQIDSLIRMKVNTGEIPDLVGYNIPSAYGLINPELYLEDLSDASWVERLNNTDYIEYTDGNIYAFPMQESAGLGGVIYNKEVFEALGLSIPTSEQAFYEVCQILKGNEITPLMMSSEFSIPQLWIEYGISLALGSESACFDMVQSLENQDAILSENQAIIEVMDSYLGLFENQLVNNDFITITYSELCERMGDGTGAMMMGNFNHVADIEYLNQEVELGMFPIPFDYNKNLEYITTNSAKGFVLFKDGGNKETGREVLELWAKPEYLELWYMDLGGISPYEDVEYGDMNEELLETYVSYTENNEALNEFTTYSIPFYNLVTSKFWLYYMEAPVNGLSGFELAEKIQQDIREYLE